MKIKSLALPITVAISGILLGAAVTGAVSAQGQSRADEARQNRNVSQEQQQETRASVEERKTEILERVESKRAEVAERLDQKRLRVCERRAEKINQIAERSTKNSEKHLAVFKKIAERTQAFYVEKELSVENYDTLVAQVDAAEAQAQAAIAATKEVSFVCNEQAQGDIGAGIREVITAQHVALKDYRTAIKDLIVGIRPAAEDDNTEQQEAVEVEDSVTNEDPQE